MPSFGNSSQLKLNTCDSDIQLICNEGIKLIDFSVITGHRTKKDQNALFPKYTKLKWPKGKHNSFPSRAVDIAPYVKPYGTLFGGKDQLLSIQNYWLGEGKSKGLAQINAFIEKAYARMIGHIERIAFINNIEIRVGIDWDKDYDLLDQSFHDLGHWELI